MSLFICPLCGGELKVLSGAYRCKKGHSFDISSEGYVNLLPVNKKNSKNPGDDKEMAAARSEFLSKGYYGKLREMLCALCGETSEREVSILDTGCGEGYYTAGIYESLISGGKKVELAGIDISKFILRRAAKRLRECEFAVASSYSLPVKDNSIDILLNCFSPLALDEFRRVLKKDGMFIYVVPGRRHLWGLKEVLYEVPYENEEKLTPYEGFEYEKVVSVSDEIVLEDPKDIAALFTMTPYYWKTPREGKERLAALERLKTETEFNIHVFRRK